MSCFKRIGHLYFLYSTLGFFIFIFCTLSTKWVNEILVLLAKYLTQSNILYRRSMEPIVVQNNMPLCHVTPA